MKYENKRAQKDSEFKNSGQIAVHSSVYSVFLENPHRIFQAAVALTLSCFNWL